MNLNGPTTIPPHHSYYSSPTTYPSNPHHYYPHLSSGNVPPHYEQQQQQQQHSGPMSMPTFSTHSSRGLKRKPSSSVKTNVSCKTCDLCDHDDPILQVQKCGHTFHSRCVNAWPLVSCPVCNIRIESLTIVNVDMGFKTSPRSGKWTKAEEEFVHQIIEVFEAGMFPIANGTPVRLILSKLLNCSPMRLSKKFQKNALGKRTHRMPKHHHQSGTGSGSGSGHEQAPSYRVFFDKEAHAALQKKLSALEFKFREQMVLMRRSDNTDQNGLMDLMHVSVSVRQFWASNFIKFASIVGQKVEGMHIDSAHPKKKQQTMSQSRTRTEPIMDHHHWSTPAAPQPLSHSSATPMWNSEGLWQPFPDTIEYSWKSDLGQTIVSSGTNPTTPMGTRWAKKNSFDHMVFDLLGTNMDDSIQDELMLSIESSEAHIIPSSTSTNASTFSTESDSSWEKMLFNDDDLLDHQTKIVDDEALFAWSNIQLTT